MKKKILSNRPSNITTSYMSSHISNNNLSQQISMTSNEFNLLWRETGKLLGTISLRQPIILKSEKDFEDYPEMANEIGGICIPTKETMINTVKFVESFGPFTKDDWKEIQDWCDREIKKNSTTSNIQQIAAIFGYIDKQIKTGKVSQEKASYMFYMMLLNAHEMGHHKWIPYDFKTSMLIIDSVYKVTKDQQSAAHLANIYEDMVINNRHYQEKGLPFQFLYRKMTQKNNEISKFWTLYMKTYEQLWNKPILPKGNLLSNIKSKIFDKGTDNDVQMQKDVEALAQIVQDSNPASYIQKAKAAADIMNKYLDQKDLENPNPLDSEISTKPSQGKKSKSTDGQSKKETKDKESTAKGSSNKSGKKGNKNRIKEAAKKAAGGMAKKQKGEKGEGRVRDIEEYQDLMTRMNLAETADEAIKQYYLELAAPYSVQFPSVPRLSGSEVMEGIKDWEPGVDSIDKLDIPLSLQQGIVIPGYTTLQREWVEGHDVKESYEPPDVLLYVDASGSMQNPKEGLSPLVLAATIVAESALNVGKQVRSCGYDSHRKYSAMNDFSNERDEIMKYLTSYSPSESSTTFPFHDFISMYEKHQNEPLHFCVVSDSEFLDSLISSFDEKPGIQILSELLLSRKGGGTLFLDAEEEDIIKTFNGFSIQKLELDNKLHKIVIPELRLTIYPVNHFEGLQKAAGDMAQATYDPYSYITNKP